MKECSIIWTSETHTGLDRNKLIQFTFPATITVKTKKNAKKTIRGINTVVQQ